MFLLGLVHWLLSSKGVFGGGHLLLLGGSSLLEAHGASEDSSKGDKSDRVPLGGGTGDIELGLCGEELGGMARKAFRKETRLRGDKRRMA